MTEIQAATEREYTMLGNTCDEVTFRAIVSRPTILESLAENFVETTPIVWRTYESRGKLRLQASARYGCVVCVCVWGGGCLCVRVHIRVCMSSGVRVGPKLMCVGPL